MNIKSMVKLAAFKAELAKAPLGIARFKKGHLRKRDIMAGALFASGLTAAGVYSANTGKTPINTSPFIPQPENM
jgi:hypothetical protein